MDYDKAQYDPREAAAKEVAYQHHRTNLSGGISGGLRDVPETTIREKGPIGKAQETLGYLGELESLNSEIRRRLYGPFPESGQAGQKSPHEPSLEEMLTWICQRTAMAVGDAKNLLSKLD